VKNEAEARGAKNTAIACAAAGTVVTGVACVLNPGCAALQAATVGVNAAGVTANVVAVGLEIKNLERCSELLEALDAVDAQIASLLENVQGLVGQAKEMEEDVTSRAGEIQRALADLRAKKKAEEAATKAELETAQKEKEAMAQEKDAMAQEKDAMALELQKEKKFFEAMAQEKDAMALELAEMRARIAANSSA